MQIRAEEISQVIREQIKDYDKKVEVSERLAIVPYLRMLPAKGRPAQIKEWRLHAAGQG